ncbi:MAG: nicotinate-nucleotide adenylyltransferase [Planctomycetota bacterium]|nr:nicotinate-nucleotide adenylyltransferase [Planctomycetota bacterium]
MAEAMAFFGGTFDPVHHGHLIVARAIAERGGFARVHLVPAFQPPHKTTARATAEQRLAMLTLAIADEPRLAVCSIELDRPGPSYTYETLEALRAQHGPDTPLHWVIGADMLEELHLWRRIDRVLELARLIVAVRPPWDQRLEGLLEGLSAKLGAQAAQRLREGVIRTPLLEIASRDIRERILRGRAIRYLVPAAVEGYIRANGLYVTA